MHVKTTFLSSSHAFLFFHAFFQKRKEREKRRRKLVHHVLEESCIISSSYSLRFSFFSIFLILKFIASNLKFLLSLSESSLPLFLSLSFQTKITLIRSLSLSTASFDQTYFVPRFVKSQNHHRVPCLCLPNLSLSLSLPLSLSPFLPCKFVIRTQISLFSFQSLQSSLSLIFVWSAIHCVKALCPSGPKMFAKKESFRKNLIFHFSCFFINSPLKVFWFRLFCFSQKILFPNFFRNWFQNFNPCCLGSKSGVQSERTLFA